MSPADRRLDAESLQALPPLPREKEGPVFAEPWEAQAFALAVKLSEHGYFTWKEWAGALAGELKAAVDRGEPTMMARSITTTGWPPSSAS